MDITSLSLFIGGGSLVAALLTGLLKKAVQGIDDRYGALATQVVLFLVSLIISFLISVSPLVPKDLLALTVSVFVGSMAVYEVLYKAVWQQAIQGKV